MDIFSKVLKKEMAMAHSSYARAAGIQSEISKVTVTRVASSEVECKRQTNVYKKDMIITINNITREQRMLRKAIVRYSKKKKQHKMIKEKREKELLEKEQKAREELQKWEQIHALLNIENGATEGLSTEDGVSGDQICNKETVEDETNVLSDENNNDKFQNKTKITACKYKKANQNIEEKEQSLNPFEVLPAITEAENEEQNAEIEPEEKTTDVVSSTAETKSSDENSSASLSPLFALTLRPLKPKKQIVSFSDIIKLKHSHNTNKLFDMVHVLAEKHGVNESVQKRREDRKNSRIPRGSTDAVISESLRKAASVLYPMKFGYGDHESNNKEKFDFYDDNILPETTEISLEPGVSETSDKSLSNGMHSTKKMKRNKVTLGLNEEWKKIRKEDMLKNGITEEGRRYTHVSSRSSSSKLLPPISSAKSSPNHSRNNSVSWTEAFGLLKIVHSIE